MNMNRTAVRGGGKKRFFFFFLPLLLLLTGQNGTEQNSDARVLYEVANTVLGTAEVLSTLSELLRVYSGCYKYAISKCQCGE